MLDSNPGQDSEGSHGQRAWVRGQDMKGSLRHIKGQGSTHFFDNKRKPVRQRNFSMQIFYWFFKSFAHVRNAFL